MIAEMPTVKVMGVPVQQGSLSKSRTGHVYHQNAKALKPWRERIAQTVWEELHNDGIFDAFYGPMSVSITFVLPRPKRPKHPLPIVRPDIDKLVRAVLDALTGMVYKDDCQVVALDVQKVYAEDCAPHMVLSWTPVKWRGGRIEVAA